MKEPIHIISLGAGVQSSTMALMAAKGEITPMPVAAIFADTQAEPKSVYLWLDWLEKQLPFPVHRVIHKHGLWAESVAIKKRKDGKGHWTFSGVPHYCINRDGTHGHGPRQCTHDFKLTPILKAIRALTKQHEVKSAVSWIGISLDEISRMKPSRVRYAENRWPLIEKEMKRHDCLRWMEQNAFPKPPRSACVFCPYHSNAEWRQLQVEEPDEFARAVQFEKEYGDAKMKTLRESAVRFFLHASRKPLSEVDFSTEEERGQMSLFNNECEGMCGV